jgi:hypothetical protein
MYHTTLCPPRMISGKNISKAGHLPVSHMYCHTIEIVLCLRLLPLFHPSLQINCDFPLWIYCRPNGTRLWGKWLLKHETDIFLHTISETAINDVLGYLMVTLLHWKKGIQFCATVNRGIVSYNVFDFCQSVKCAYIKLWCRFYTVVASYKPAKFCCDFTSMSVKLWQSSPILEQKSFHLMHCVVCKSSESQAQWLMPVRCVQRVLWLTSLSEYLWWDFYTSLQ